MANLVTASHEQMSASSGRLITPAPALASPPREPNIRSSGSGGSTNFIIYRLQQYIIGIGLAN
jgi:hypothetical protein